MNALEKFYFSKSEPNKSCLLAMRTIALGIHENMTETTKYGMPCICYGTKQFCYLWVDKKTNHPYYLMVKGNLMKHPKLESGTRAKMKIYPVNPDKDIPIDDLNTMFEEALKLH